MTYEVDSMSLVIFGLGGPYRTTQHLTCNCTSCQPVPFTLGLLTGKDALKLQLPVISSKLPRKESLYVIWVLDILESNGVLQLKISTGCWYKVAYTKTSRLSINQHRVSCVNNRINENDSLRLVGEGVAFFHLQGSASRVPIWPPTHVFSPSWAHNI